MREVEPSYIIALDFRFSRKPRIGTPDTLSLGLASPGWGCLQKDLNRRIHDMADARVVIEEALELPSDKPNATHARPIRSHRLQATRVLATLTVIGVLLAVAGWQLARQTTGRPAGPALTYLTLPLPHGVDLQSAPAVSPDSSSIAFVGKDTGGTRLYVRALSSPDFRAIPGTEGARQPFWSPDGRWVAFFAGGKLKKVAVDGGTPVEICSASDSRGGSWGRAGVIVFTPHLIDHAVYRVSADGGTPEPVTQLDESRGDNSHRWPAFLPDGVHFLYFVRSFEDGRRGVYVGRADRSAEPPGARLIESESEALYVPLESDSDGVVMTVLPDGVQIQRFDAAARTLVGHPRLAKVRAGGSTPYERAMIGASQRTLVVADAPIDRSSRLASAARDGSDVRVWPERAAYNCPRLSPDGNRLVFQRVDGRRGTPDLWVRDLIRGTETRITSPPAHALLPVWSPGSDRLAFLWGRIGAASPAIGPADGTKGMERRACPALRCEPSDWSPDGRMLILTAYTDKSTDVWAMPLEPAAGEDETRPLFNEPFNERDARISPDGDWVAYVSDESGREEVSVRRLSGRDRTVISSAGGHQPVWRRDGAELFYVDAQGSLHAVPITRSSRGRLVPGLPVRLDVPPIGVGHWSTQYDVNRDGSRVYYLDRAQPEPSTRIEVILGWPALIH